jgi:hypothetical protein
MDWVRGLSMCDYTHRYLLDSSAHAWQNVQQTINRLRRSLRPAFERGQLAAEVHQANETPNLVLTLKGDLDARFFRKTRRQLARMLRRHNASVTLQIQYLNETQRPALQSALDKLGRYRDRVRIHMSEASPAGALTSASLV